MRYVSVTALSHDGLLREHNEDSLVVGAWTLCGATTTVPQTFLLPVDDPVVVAVADGLGGHPAGEVASAVVVQALARVGPDLDGEQQLRAAIEACNQAVYAEAALDPERTAMGSTLAGVLIADDDVLAFNVGDSRVYLVGDDELSRVSVDDNAPPAPGQRRSSVVTQTLGGRFGTTPVDPHVSARPVADGDRYLVCSDGLTDPVGEDAIAAILREHDGSRAAFELWRAAIDGGGPDNITVALVEISSAPDPESEPEPDDSDADDG